VTAATEAIEMATVAARAAASKLADDVVVIDVSDQLVITDCFVIASPLDAAGLRRHRRAHPAPRRARFLRAGSAVA
jgi:ribosomal silencing factor RsfS